MWKIKRWLGSDTNIDNVIGSICKRTKGNKRIEMCEKKYVKKTKNFRDDRVLIKREYPLGIKSAQNLNESHFFSFAMPVVAAVDDRQTKLERE